MSLIHDWIGIDKNIGFRCSKCKRFRSAKNAMVQGEIRGARASGEFRSFFATLAADGRSHTKISIQKAIVLIYCWVNDFSSKQTTAMLDTYGLHYRRQYASHRDELGSFENKNSSSDAWN